MSKETMKKGSASQPARRSLAAEIAALERRIDGMYMDEDLAVVEEDVAGVPVSVDELVVEPVALMDDEAMQDEELELDEVGQDDDVMDEMTLEDVEPEAGCMASESKPGVEDEINQDYLDDVLKLRDTPESIVTAPSMLDVARTSSNEYVARVKTATARLDRVADYLEKQGQRKLALRIDTISDALDARIMGGRR